MKAMKKMIIGLALLLTISQAQSKDRAPEAGYFSFGLRQTLSLFGDEGYTGYGSGGQFRIRLGEQLNTEWFADYISTPYASAGKRADGHIGWSVMFYPFSTQKKFVPYLIAGHCFDFTRITPFNSVLDLRSDESKSRWSSATQAGIGMHYNIDERFDITFKSQYMVHLGKEIEAHVINYNGREYLVVEDPADGEQTLEGHVLLTLSLNYRIADLW
jgi:opacity protein-like surface antigen